MENPKVSVIVPVYNVEKYLDKCLDSLVHQTLQEIEILVVNDGSPDRSQEIIDQYVEQYPEKVFGFIKENGGLGDARNYGIERAKGEYIGFVDSDDWVDKKMFEAMYRMAVEENNDVIICDFIEINDGWEMGHVANGYRGDAHVSHPQKYEFILNSLNPATACNKIFRRTLFHIKKFPTHWYEDMATTPILLSYANKIGYLSIALYYYRQIAQSITKATNDEKTLAVVKSWEACLCEVNAGFEEPMEAAVYKSIYAFLNYKSEFAQQFLNYVREKKDLFKNNVVVSNWIKQGEVENIFRKQLIPKKIHYFWFGNNPKSELILRCISSWRKYAPDFEIIEWNETNCDIHTNLYVEQAYEAQKWAFVADYFRMEKIEQYGGIYLDTDTELMRNPSKLLLNSAFFAFETSEAVHAGIFGAVPYHPIIVRCRKSYEKASFLNKDGTFNTSYTVVKRLTDQLMKHKIILNGQEQILAQGIHIYPANKLTLDMFDGEIVAQHHYDCSWWDVKTGVVSYKNTVLRNYFANLSSADVLSDLIFQRDYYKGEYERLENSTCWSLTKPLRILADFFKKLWK